jgi:peptidoglycan/LPS O-acetylase OafA/YrhL
MIKNMQEAINRGNNLFVIVFLAAIGISVVAEIIMETDLIDKVDDMIIVGLGIIGAVWYFRNYTKRSYVPLILAILAFAAKIFAFIVELDDKAAVGDEFGILPALLLLIIITAVTLMKSKKHQPTI